MAPDYGVFGVFLLVSPCTRAHAEILSPIKKTRKTRHFGPPLLASTFQVTGQPAVRLWLAQNHDKHDEFS